MAENDLNTDYEGIFEKNESNDLQPGEEDGIPEKERIHYNEKISMENNIKETDESSTINKKNTFEDSHIEDGSYETKEKFEIDTAVMEKLDTLIAKHEQLEKDFNTKLKYDAHKEKIIDKLHAELQEHKNDIQRKLLQPIIMDVILIMDDWNKMISFYRGKDKTDLDPEKLLKLMEDFCSDLKELLYRQRVEAFRMDEEYFDPKKQKVGKKVKTEDPDLHRKVASNLRDGFEWDGDIIRPEFVSVYVFDVDEKTKNSEET